jgi:hypothetical protein
MSAVKLFVLRKGNNYIAWDGISLTDKPSGALRISQTLGRRKYPEFEMFSFPEAYDQWYMAKKNHNQNEGQKG